MTKKNKISVKALNLALFFGILCAVFLSMADFNASCDDLRSNVLRLHIIANSDSDADQKLKLKIRDRILAESGNVFDGIADIDKAIIIAEKNLTRYEEIANTVIKEDGFNYKANVFIGESYFDTREYEDFTLPAGMYNSLIISVGAAKGKNWWCVIFPEVCLPAASAKLTDTVNPQNADIATESERYIMRFKTVEIYEKIKNLLFK